LVCDWLTGHGTLVGLTEAGTLLGVLDDGDVELTGGATDVVDASVVAGSVVVEAAVVVDACVVVVEAAVVVDASVVVVVEAAVVVEPFVVVVSPGSWAGVTMPAGRDGPWAALAMAVIPVAIRAAPAPMARSLRIPNVVGIGLGSLLGR
jgi:hypothetical protein